MATFRILLLGEPRLEADRTPVEIHRRKVLALLAYLAVTERTPSRDELAALLFPRMDRERAGAGIRQTLSYLKDAVGERFIKAGAQGIGLRRDAGICVDVHEFRALLGRAGGSDAEEILAKAVRIYRGAFLAGFYLDDCPAFEGWQDAQEQEMRERCAAALVRLADMREGRGDFDAAVETARILVGLDPLEEGPQRRLMRLLASGGHLQDALRQFEAFRRLLDKEMQEEPEEETVKLRDAIRAGKLERRPAAVPSAACGSAALVFVDVPTAGWDPAAARRLSRAAERLGASGGAVLHRDLTGMMGVAFADVPTAVAAALHARLQDGDAAMRIAVHAGETGESGGAQAGRALERAAVLLRAAQEGQILVSGTAADLAAGRLPEGCTLRNLGAHRLDDLGPAMTVHGLAHPGLPSRFPPLRTLDARPGNLPGQPTFLIGREEEMAAVRRILAEDGVWLLTLTGPGGTGKTRLALHAAAMGSGLFRDGAWFVDLSTVAERAQVLPAIAAALAVREAPREMRGPEDLLRSWLAPRQLLLILDNFEHVLDAAAEVGRIAAACPGLRILATSREPLNLQGERVLQVPPMRLPGSDAEEAGPCESVRLFLERAHAVRPDLPSDRETIAAVGAVCRRLDGLPLALELAAARMRTLPPGRLLERLAQPLEVLTRGAEDLPERQRTIRREVRWSYDPLDHAEKDLFHRLAVFPDGCSVEAAEAVCRKAAGRGRRPVERLEALVEKSLLARRTEGNRTRYRMLHVIREFALERLAVDGRMPAAMGAFARYEEDLAEETAPLLQGARQEEGFGILDGEAANMSAVLAWLEAERRTGAGLGLSGALGWYWFRRARYTEGVRWLERFLAPADDAVPAAARARALYCLGWMRLMTGTRYFRSAEARDCFRESVPLWRLAGDRRGEALSLVQLSLREEEGGPSARYKMADRAVALARAAADPWSLSFCLKLAFSYMSREDRSKAEQVAALEEAIDLARGTGDPFLVSQTLHGMGDVHMFLHDHESAEPFYLESVALALKIGDSWSVLDAQMHLGSGYVARGLLDKAVECLEDVLRAAAASGARSYIGFALARLSRVALLRGDHARALRLRGAVFAMKGFPQEPPMSELLGGTRLTRASAQREFDAGRAMGVPEAVRYALGEG